MILTDSQIDELLVVSPGETPDCIDGDRFPVPEAGPDEAELQAFHADAMTDLSAADLGIVIPPASLFVAWGGPAPRHHSRLRLTSAPRRPLLRARTRRARSRARRCRLGRSARSS